MANATVYVSLDGAAYVRGGVQAHLNQAMQLHGFPKDGWKTSKWVIIAPKGLATPAGWTTLGDGNFQYVGATEDPPAFVGALWGKYYVRLVVNDGIPTLPDEKLVDETTMLSIKSPNNFEDVGVFETSQFDIVRFWVGPLQDAIRAIDAFVTGGGVAFNGDLDPTTSSSTAQYVRSLSGTAGSILVAATGAILKWAAGTVNPGRAHARSTTGAGTAMQDRTQAALAGSGGGGGDLRAIIGKNDGAGARGLFKVAYETVPESTFVDAVSLGFDGAKAVLSSLGNLVALRLASASNGDVELAPHGTGSIVLSGRLATKQRTFTANTAVADDLLLFADTTAGPLQLTLPAPSAGRAFLLKAKTALSTNTLTLARAGTTEKIDGIAASRVLSADFGAWLVASDGTDWFLFRH